MTAVHCETPSGVLNPLREVGAICREVDALFYVDFVASGGGVPVEVDGCAIDLGLLGSQKVLSLMPDLSMITVSDRAWAAVEEVGYAGYDALAPWRTGLADKYLPYTHNWQAMAGLRVALQMLQDEGRGNRLSPPRRGRRLLPPAAAGHGLAYFPGERGHFVADGDGGLRAGRLDLGRVWMPRCACAAWP